jgi:hypothetical protein
MKKILIFSLTLIIMLGLASMAEANTVSLDVWSGGEYEYRTSSNTTVYDLPQASIGLELPGKEFKFACNLSSGTINDYDTDYGYADIDTASAFLKGGYALINNQKMRLNLTAGFFDREINWDYLMYSTYLDDYVDSESYYSLTVGFDGKVTLDRKAWINFSYSWGISPQMERTYYYSDDLTADLDSISITDFKFNYLFNRRIGVALGYHCENIEFDLDNNKDKYSSVTLGAFYKF